jgi:transposase InsO family protein
MSGHTATTRGREQCRVFNGPPRYLFWQRRCGVVLATYKKELIRTRPWNGVTEVRQHTFLWIEGYYYRRRRHSTLDYLTPIEYEPGFRN